MFALKYELYKMELKENYQLFLKKLNQSGINTTILDEKYGELLTNAPFSTNQDSGLAFQGALIYTLLYKLTPYAVRLNESFPSELRVDKATLVKVCLLHQIAKSVRLVPNDNEWEITKRGMLYVYAKDNPSIRNGLHSLVIAQNCGITFTEEEAEAMTINDRDLSETQARFHASVLASIVRMANEMTYLEMINITKEKK